MALLGKKKGKKKGGILDSLGVSTEVVATPEDQATKNRHATMESIWVYLRDQIDKAIHDYYVSDSFSKLEDLIDRPAIDALKADLQALKADDVYWHQPNRKTETNRVIKIVKEELNKKGFPTQFQVEETWNDFSVHRRIKKNENSLDLLSRAPGHERKLLITINIIGGETYRVESIVRAGDDLVE